MKKIFRKESNILIFIALVIYIILNLVNKFFIKIPNFIYLTILFMVIGITLSALKSQKQGK